MWIVKIHLTSSEPQLMAYLNNVTHKGPASENAIKFAGFSTYIYIYISAHTYIHIYE